MEEEAVSETPCFNKNYTVDKVQKKMSVVTLCLNQILIKCELTL
jgi:hypothetical protein